MNDQVIKGADFFLGLSIFAILMAIVLGIFGYVQSGLTEKKLTLQNGISNVNNMDIKQYDQKIVDGSTVKTTITGNDGMQLGIIVETVKSGKSGKVYNYGALLSGATESNYVTSTGNFDDNNGQASWYTSSYANGDDGEIIYNTKTNEMDKTGGTGYIRNNAKFDAKLIKNESEDVIGYYFKQRSSK